ncbi:MAG: BAX inhibitor (BI)-1/YccA family protein, partial [Deltaproteobacteria bacterium]|nr:BAX inhibitor (BI)-1/YccA family protein [Deltaproteobacteria bacterium]
METAPMLSGQTQIRVNQFIRSVYNWMAIGLGLTGIVAFYVSNNQYLTQLIFGNRLLFFALIIG